MRITFFILLYLSSLLASAQSSFNSNYLDAISTQSLRQHVYTLAADSMQGRGTATAGEHKAAQYIINHFKAQGLHPLKDTTYLQDIGLWSQQWGEINVQINKTPLIHFQDFVYLGTNPIEPRQYSKAIFIGRGDAASLDRLELKGKVAVALADNLNNWYQLANRLKQRDALALFMVPAKDTSAFDKLSDLIATRHQRQLLLKDKPQLSNRFIHAFALKQSTATSIFNCSFEELKALSGRQLRRLPQPTVSLHGPVHIQRAKAYNVAAILPANNSTKDALVISAHYDHMGERHNRLYAGADDNASGTAAMLELAHAFVPLRDKLDKNLIFLATSGEEKGLLGALYFANHPQEHDFNIKANINIDMVGRIDSAHKSNYIYTIGNQHYPEFDTLVQAANKLTETLSIQNNYNEPQPYGNFIRLSDHYAFHRLNIPVLAFFSGLHADYHKPGDTPEKINYTALSQRVKLIFITTYLATKKTAFNQ
ncbi:MULTISPECIES: M20/M25/M40 family metallo-hydrolase [unclassified Carboxylicivirga]|uniref:M20/M25/M40 family metallo-hydrolase n=1 Tax=Carboxylicivirga TaxID=1628153 RepID=UPI003D34F940